MDFYILYNCRQPPRLWMRSFLLLAPLHKQNFNSGFPSQYNTFGFDIKKRPFLIINVILKPLFSKESIALKNSKTVGLITAFSHLWYKST